MHNVNQIAALTAILSCHLREQLLINKFTYHSIRFDGVGIVAKAIAEAVKPNTNQKQPITIIVPILAYRIASNWWSDIISIKNKITEKAAISKDHPTKGKSKITLYSLAIRHNTIIIVITIINSCKGRRYSYWSPNPNIRPIFLNAE